MTILFFFLTAVAIAVLINDLIVCNIKKLYYKSLLESFFEEAYKVNASINAEQYHSLLKQLEKMEDIRAIWEINKFNASKTKQN